MAEGADQHGFKGNIRSRETWIRLIYMIVMAFAWNIGVLIFWAVAILQFLTQLITGDTNPNLRRFGRQLAEFFRQTARFETFDTEIVPFPFTAWPSGDEEAPPLPAGRSETRRARPKPKGPARLRTRGKPKPQTTPNPQTPDDTKPIENDGPTPDDQGPSSDDDQTK